MSVRDGSKGDCRRPAQMAADLPTDLLYRLAAGYTAHVRAAPGSTPPVYIYRRQRPFPIVYVEQGLVPVARSDRRTSCGAGYLIRDPP